LHMTLPRCAFTVISLSSFGDSRYSPADANDSKRQPAHSAVARAAWQMQGSSSSTNTAGSPATWRVELARPNGKFADGNARAPCAPSHRTRVSTKPSSITLPPDFVLPFADQVGRLPAKNISGACARSKPHSGEAGEPSFVRSLRDEWAKCAPMSRTQSIKIPSATSGPMRVPATSAAIVHLNRGRGERRTFPPPLPRQAAPRSHRDLGNPPGNAFISPCFRPSAQERRPRATLPTTHIGPTVAPTAKPSHSDAALTDLGRFH
jgi:hypothetical protein